MKYYITTAIDYVNAAPHLGHALEKIQSDVLARYHRRSGDDVFFLTGSDENSLKNVQSAEKLGISTRDLVNQNAKKFKDMRKALNLSYDRFIRTTSPSHKRGVREFWKIVNEKGDIYKKEYAGYYCVGCEEFKTEKDLTSEGLCPDHLLKPELVKELNYFFRLSKYQDQLKRLIENDTIKIVPDERKQDVLSFINQGLQDISISRSKQRAKGWGIPVPGDSSQIVYVWFDALINYITGIGYGTNEEEYNKWWPADTHIVGKNILRFHAVIWPAMLLSAGLPLPRQIFAHGFLTINGQKMSKSLGNFVDPFALVEKYGSDIVRYYLLREVPIGKDGDFSEQKLQERYNSDLAGGLGNLVSRVLTLASQAGWFMIKNEELALTPRIQKAQEVYKTQIEAYNFSESIEAIWALVRDLNDYIEKERPWEKLKNGDKTPLANLLFALDVIAKLLFPFMPKTSKTILRYLNIQKDGAYKPRRSQPLFPRIENI